MDNSRNHHDNTNNNANNEAKGLHRFLKKGKGIN